MVLIMVEKVDLNFLILFIADLSTPTVVDCYADWCMPCNVSSPQFDQLSKKYPQAKFIKVNVYEQQAIASEFLVRGVPSFFVLRWKKVVGAVVGADLKRLESYIKKEIDVPTTVEAHTYH